MVTHETLKQLKTIQGSKNHVFNAKTAENR